MKNVKVQLTTNIPVDESHGAVAGRIFGAVRHGLARVGSVIWTIVGDTGEEVGILRSEAKEVGGDNGK